MMTNYFDTRWKKTDYWYYDGLFPKLKEDAPDWVKESYDNYMRQHHEKFGKKNVHKNGKRWLFCDCVTSTKVPLRLLKKGWKPNRRYLTNDEYSIPGNYWQYIIIELLRNGYIIVIDSKIQKMVFIGEI